MHRARHTAVCTAQNAFKPSIVLWQQFVAAGTPNQLQRFSSTIATHDPEQPLPQPPSHETSEEPSSPVISDQADQSPAELPPKKHAYPRESIAAANERQIDDIDPHDLSATLEAHRASNRASLLRGVQSSQRGTYFKQTKVRSPLSLVVNVEKEPGEMPLIRHVVPEKPRIPTVVSLQGIALKRQYPRPPVTEDDPITFPRQTVFRAAAAPMSRQVKKPKKAVTESQNDQNLDDGPPIDLMLRQDGSKAKLKELKSKSRKESTPKKWPTIATFKQGQQLLEYKGENVVPLTDLVVPENELPWTVKEGLQSMTGAERLSEEISRFNSYMMPTPNEHIARQAVIKELSDLVKQTFPKHTVSVFGSEWNGLALATSDIDLRLSVPTLVGSKLEKAPRYVIRKTLLKDLTEFHLVMQKAGMYMLCSIRHARYPLITVQHIKSRLDLQVVGSNDTSVSRAYILKYLAEYPGLKELVAVLKVLFDIRGLSDVFRGGLGSYSVFMMAVASIKLNPEIPIPDLGQRLLSFLNFWAKFDTYSLGVSIEPAEVFPKRSKTFITVKQKKNLDEKGLYREKMGQIDPAQPYLLCLQDPADATNDVGKKGFAIKHIQATFAHLEKELRQSMQENTRPSLLAPLVGPAYILNRERRAVMEEYGASVGPLPELAVEETQQAPPAEMTIEEFREEFPLPNSPPVQLSLDEVVGIVREFKDEPEEVGVASQDATEEIVQEGQDVVEVIEKEASDAAEQVEPGAQDANELIAEKNQEVVEQEAESASEVIEQAEEITPKEEDVGEKQGEASQDKTA